MKDAFNKLWEFHETYDCSRRTAPGLPDQETRDLRICLLREEFEEYLEGEANNDIVEIADALGDILYIALGTAVAYGIPLDQVFDEIHRSNMSKLDPVTLKPIRRADGKILKGDGYSPPDIAGLIERTLCV